jgi:hypothetical protein
VAPPVVDEDGDDVDVEVDVAVPAFFGSEPAQAATTRPREIIVATSAGGRCLVRMLIDGAAG